MKLNFALPHTFRIASVTQPWELDISGPDQKRVMKRADELGFDMISVPEHMIVPEQDTKHYGDFYFHSTVAQGYIAGATENIRIGTSITLLPLQHPVIMAKALSTADWMSGGRITVAFGVGVLKDEFNVLNVPFHERGKMADEYLEAIIELWTKPRPSYDGKYVSFKDIAFKPKPVQSPHLPIWMGGDSDAALKRAARFASGWIPSFRTKLEDIPARIDFIKSQSGYDGKPFDIMYGLATDRFAEDHSVTSNPGDDAGRSATEFIDGLGRLTELGVTMSSLPIPAVRSLDEYLDYAQWIAEEIKPKIG